MPLCPNCFAAGTVKKGRIYNGKQCFLCHDCGGQFVEHSYKKVIDRLLLEWISLADIARAAQVSEPWLQSYVNEKYALVPHQEQVRPKKKGKLTQSV